MDFLQQAKQAAAYAATQAKGAIGGLSSLIVPDIIPFGRRKVRLGVRLGEGAFAFVHKAQDVVTGEQFAVKRCLCQCQEHETMARKEIRLLKRLRHPNIVKYHGAIIRSDDKGFKEYLILLELAKCNLVQLIRRRRGVHLSELAVCDIFTGVCCAVSFMHSQQPPVAHRDVKCDNLVVSSRGHVKLCDMGSATTRSKAYTDPRERAEEEERIAQYSSECYRAPEMIHLYSGKVVNEKVDIWAMGCVLFMLAFHTHPFYAEGKLAIVNGVWSIPADSPYSDGLHSLIKYLLAVDPDQRPDARRVLKAVYKWRNKLRGGDAIEASVLPTSRSSLSLHSPNPPTPEQRRKKKSKQRGDDGVGTVRPPQVDEDWVPDWGAHSEGGEVKAKRDNAEVDHAENVDHEGRERVKAQAETHATHTEGDDDWAQFDPEFSDLTKQRVEDTGEDVSHHQSANSLDDILSSLGAEWAIGSAAADGEDINQRDKDFDEILSTLDLQRNTPADDTQRASTLQTDNCTAESLTQQVAHTTKSELSTSSMSKLGGQWDMLDFD